MTLINITEKPFNLTDIISYIGNESPQRLTKFICGFCRCHSVCSNIWEVSFVTTLLILMPLTRKSRNIPEQPKNQEHPKKPGTLPRKPGTPQENPKQAQKSPEHPDKKPEISKSRWRTNMFRARELL